MSTLTCDVLIVGGGMVGLCLAHQLLERGMAASITVLDKEPELGRHSSGRSLSLAMPNLNHDIIEASINSFICAARSCSCDRQALLDQCSVSVTIPSPIEESITVAIEKSFYETYPALFGSHEQA